MLVRLKKWRSRCTFVLERQAHVVKKSTGRHYAMRIQHKSDLLERNKTDPWRVVNEKVRPWMEGGGSKHYARSTVSIAIAGRLGNWMFLVGVVSLVARNIAQQDSCTSFLSL